jgi:hypothetical protein
MTIIITIGIAYCHLIFIADICSSNWLRSQEMQFKLFFIDTESRGEYRFRIKFITGKAETTIKYLEYINEIYDAGKGQNAGKWQKCSMYMPQIWIMLHITVKVKVNFSSYTA